MIARMAVPVALVLLASSCGGTGVWQQRPSPAQNLPKHFSIDPDRAPPAGSKGCPVHLIDERDNTRLVLVRSVATPPTGDGDVAVGDYRTEPQGNYGMAPGELLRIQCPSGRPQGAVN
jgi:hypothetical protein